MTVCARRQIYSAVTVCIAVAMSSLTAQAQTFTEADFLRQSKTCEAATRLPWGDVDNHAYGDCMMHQGRLRSKEERDKNYAFPRTPWNLALNKSLLWATEDRCETWAHKQPENAPQMHAPGIWTHNHAWNLCMEQQRILTRPISRAPTPKEPDFRAMAAEQRTMTIVAPSKKKEFEFFGCHTHERYEEIGEAVGGVLFIEFKNLGWTSGADPPDEASERARFAKNRKLIEDSADCRFWKVGTRVQIKAVAKELLCLSPAGSADRCYWTLETAINKWE